MKPLMPIDDALEKVLASVASFPGLSVGVESVPLQDALGRNLAEDIYSNIDVPPSNNSAMDGYALRLEDIEELLTNVGSVVLKVGQRIAAGEMGVALERGEAARIFTGASIPPNADAVVIQENVTLEENDVSKEDCGVCIKDKVVLGQNIRLRGQDIAQGDLVFPVGRLIQPADLGLLASLGIATLKVNKKLRVAVMSTGNELVEPGQPLDEGQIYNSNRYTLLGLVKALGCEFVDLGIVKDDPDITAKKLQEAVDRADVIITSGGVSVGEEDHVKKVVESLGSLHLWKLAIKPGKPLAFGEINQKPFFGLPGNPVSTFVTFCLVVRPFLLKAQGRKDYHPISFTVKAQFSKRNKGQRQDYVRVILIEENGSTYVELYPTQSSGVLSSISHSSGLAIIPPGETIVEGQDIQYLPMTTFLN